MATYSVKITTEKDLQVEVTFPSYYQYSDHEFIWLKSALEVIKVELMQHELMSSDHVYVQYDIRYTSFLSPDDIKHFIVCGRKSSQTEFMTAYNMAQDVLRDAFVSYKHLDKTLEALELDKVGDALIDTANAFELEYTQPQNLTEYLATVLQKDDNL